MLFNILGLFIGICLGVIVALPGVIIAPKVADKILYLVEPHIPFTMALIIGAISWVITYLIITIPPLIGLIYLAKLCS